MQLENIRTVVSVPKKNTVLRPVTVKRRHRRKSGVASTAITAIICLLLLCAAVIDYEPINRVRQAVSGIFTGELPDYEGYGDKIFVDALIPGIEQVLSQGLFIKRDIFMPASGTIGERFEAGKHEGITIKCSADASVYACREGIVTYITETAMGKEITLLHYDGQTSKYVGCDLVTVEEGATVEKAELLGSVMEIEGKSELMFCYYSAEGKAIDPLSLIYK